MKIFFSILDVVCGFGVMFMWALIAALFSYCFFHTADIHEQLLVLMVVVWSSVLIVTYYYDFARSVKNLIEACKKRTTDKME